jgi:hypothetical protein
MEIPKKKKGLKKRQDKRKEDIIKQRPWMAGEQILG